jgi:hypothetical protein
VHAGQRYLSVEAAVHTLEYVYIVRVRTYVWAGHALISERTALTTFATEAMEAVAAVGVAAAAMQFFDIAAKALKTYSEIRQSIKGESKFNEDLGKSIHELQQIQSSLNVPLSGTDPQTDAVINIRKECNKIAKSCSAGSRVCSLGGKVGGDLCRPRSGRSTKPRTSELWNSDIEIARAGSRKP